MSSKNRFDGAAARRERQTQGIVGLVEIFKETMKKIFVIALFSFFGGSALADQHDCAVNATAIVSDAQGQTKLVTIPVNKGFCIDTAVFSKFFIGDNNAWRVDNFTGRDATHTVRGYYVTPLSAGLTTTMHLEKASGTVSTIILKSAE